MTQEAPLLCSVIVPVYNGQATITRCLDALAHQTIDSQKFEVIVVDDGSSDGTGDTVERWIARHHLGNWRLLSQANAGPAAARNYGAQLAKAGVLLFTDADCTPSASWLESLVAPFLGNAPPAAVMGRYLSQQREPAARFAQYEFEERYALMAQRQQIDLIATYAAAYGQEIFLRSGGFDTNFPKANNEDVELSYRLSREGHRMLFVPEATVTHPHASTWGRYFKIKWKRAYWRMQVYRRFPGKAVADSYTPQTLKAQLLFGLPAALGVAAASITGGWYWLLPALAFLAAAMPTALFMTRHNRSFFLWAFWGLWLRSLAFTGGVVWGLLRPHPLLGPGSRVTGVAALTSYE